ncbi:uncharacterized protein HD556DRAFT_1329588 [Suillus plorans]|uniref:Uncharacterized protein n=1 Tax=Suillus plorans TaxID=116603 RepID=A0A9P7J5H0_9AGAM|nr:uncharacterized protein HD556DRAFT_1329588 [Suillus plorans]KAG1803679.1 hypothetical protein HD556DRAFT_1329588 [Suillus plorans]
MMICFVSHSLVSDLHMNPKVSNVPNARLIDIQYIVWTPSSYTGVNPSSDEAVHRQDECSGILISSSTKKKLRKGYLPRYPKDNRADQWEANVTGITFKSEETRIQK